MHTDNLQGFSYLVDSLFGNFRYVSTLLLLPFGINLVAFLLNIESLIRYRNSSKMLVGGLFILTFLVMVIYKLNVRINTAEREITDIKIVFVSVVLVVVGFILAMSPYWILNKNKLR